MNAIVKEAQKPFWKGLGSLLWKKLKPLGITLIISIVFALTFFFASLPELGDPLGFMWYIEWMLIVPAIYYALYYLLKNKKTFYIVVAAVVVASYILEVFVFKQWGLFRGLIGIGIGILLHIIPKNNWKIGKFNINILIVVVLLLGTIAAACFKTYIPHGDHLFKLFLFPALLYFASCVNINFKLFNYLGGLSFGLYAYQTVCRVFELTGLLNDKEHNLILFGIIAGLTVIDDLIKRIVKKHKNKNLQMQKTNDAENKT